jgi:hypothetical protein
VRRLGPFSCRSSGLVTFAVLTLSVSSRSLCQRLSAPERHCRSRVHAKAPKSAKQLRHLRWPEMHK